MITDASETPFDLKMQVRELRAECERHINARNAMLLELKRQQDFNMLLQLRIDELKRRRNASEKIIVPTRQGRRSSHILDTH